MTPNDNFPQVIRGIKKCRISEKLERTNRESKCKEMNGKNTLLKENDHSLCGFFPENDFMFPFLQTVPE